jgi:hypothetical protein
VAEDRMAVLETVRKAIAEGDVDARTDLTTIPPLTTIGIPGGSRALETRRPVAVGRRALR